ncbi:hypothetical protein PTKIN_Ptkin16aG0484400 [Pterospermum kingtungense]
MSDFFRNPEFATVPPKKRIKLGKAEWVRHEAGCLKFNVDSFALGKPNPAGIGGVLRDHEAKVKIRFSKAIGVADSNLAEVLASREAFLLFASS